jgi:hypothetical protein
VQLSVYFSIKMEPTHSNKKKTKKEVNTQLQLICFFSLLVGR